LVAERKLSGLAEEACDAAVLAHGYDPRDYSEFLLDLARSVRRAGARVGALGVAMPGIGLEYRIRQMLSGHPAPRVSRAHGGRDGSLHDRCRDFRGGHARAGAVWVQRPSRI